MKKEDVITNMKHGKFFWKQVRAHTFLKDKQVQKASFQLATAFLERAEDCRTPATALKSDPLIEKYVTFLAQVAFIERISEGKVPISAKVLENVWQTLGKTKNKEFRIGLRQNVQAKLKDWSEEFEKMLRGEDHDGLLPFLEPSLPWLKNPIRCRIEEMRSNNNKVQKEKPSTAKSPRMVLDVSEDPNPPKRPVRMLISNKQHSPSPRASPTPKSPEKKPKTPEKKSKTPEKKPKSPEKKSKTPEKKSKTPEKKSKTPEKKSKTPEKKASPRARKSPPAKTGSPARKSPEKKKTSQKKPKEKEQKDDAQKDMEEKEEEDEPFPKLDHGALIRLFDDPIQNSRSFPEEEKIWKSLKARFEGGLLAWRTPATNLEVIWRTQLLRLQRLLAGQGKSRKDIVEMVKQEELDKKEKKPKKKQEENDTRATDVKIIMEKHRELGEHLLSFHSKQQKAVLEKEGRPFWQHGDESRIQGNLLHMNDQFLRKLKHNVSSALFHPTKGIISLRGDARSQARVQLLRTVNNLWGLRSLFLDAAAGYIVTGVTGTGKTTFAKVTAHVYGNIGVFIDKKAREYTPHQLVTETVGGTPIQTTKAILSSINGVFFVDEAYSLSRECAGSKLDAKYKKNETATKEADAIYEKVKERVKGSGRSGGRKPRTLFRVAGNPDGADHGQEAINALVLWMEKMKGLMVFMMAGYENSMKCFLDRNEGLNRRFPIRVHLGAYSGKDLAAETILMVQKRLQSGAENQKDKWLTLTEEAKEYIRKWVIELNSVHQFRSQLGDVDELSKFYIQAVSDAIADRVSYSMDSFMDMMDEVGKKFVRTRPQPPKENKDL